MISGSSILGISGASGSIGSKAKYSKKILRIESRLEDSLSHISQEFSDKSISRYIHLAAITDVKLCNLNPDLCFLNNTDNAVKFYLAAREAKVKRFIFVSTSHVYKVSQSSLLDINSPLGPISNYGKSKLSAEKKLSKLDEGFHSLSIARVFSVLDKSAREHFLFHGLLRSARNKDFSPIPGLKNIRDFLSASQVVNELVRLALSEEFPPMVNICSGEGRSIENIAREVFSSNGLEARLDEIHAVANDKFNKIIGVPTFFK